MFSSQKSLRSMELKKQLARERSVDGITSHSHSSSAEYSFISSGTSSSNDCNHHPVLARMLRSLKAQRVKEGVEQPTSNSFHQNKSENSFVVKPSFTVTSNDNNKHDDDDEKPILFGREYELEQLMKIFHEQTNRLTSKKSSSFHSKNDGTKRRNTRPAGSHFALVHGKSGSGKSALVDAFQKLLVQQQRRRRQDGTLFFARGKFDQLKTHVPYAALIKASRDLAQQAFNGPHAEEIQNRLRAELSSDMIALLATIVEELSVLVDNDDNGKQNNKENSKKASPVSISMAGKGFTRFKLLLRSFLRSIASPETPVVLFLDDLQWADVASLEVLAALLTDKLSNYVMLILAYRDDEISKEVLESHLLKKTNCDDDDNSFSQKSSSSVFTSNIICPTDIEVNNLNLKALNQMVSAVLNMDPESTISLTNIIMNKTQGNPFYALNFMDMLHAEDMLQQTHDNLWEWNESIILQQTDVSDNLAKILEKKILRLPEKVKSILQLAAFIGHDFAPGVLTTIVHEEQDMIEGEYSFDLFDKTVIQQWIVDALNLALEEGLVETSATSNGEGEVTYKFSHDKIQHCLYKDLMPDDVERRLLHQRIGKLIWNTISSQDYDTVDDWILFLAADNLNRGPKFVDDDGDRVEMVELNVRAGKLAASKAAFLVGVEYLRCGEKLITDDLFVENNYDLCMDLWCVASDMELSVGDFRQSSELAKKIHKHARQIEDEFPAYLTEIKSLAMQGNLTNAMALAFKVLKQMGEKFPKNITQLTVVQEFIRTKLMIGSRKPEDLMKLPPLTDKKKLFMLELLSSISGYAYMAGDTAKFAFVAVGLRMARLTLQHGLSELYAPQAFVGYGTLCCFFGKFELGLAYGQAAQTLFDRFPEAGTFEGRTQLHFFSCIYAWSFGIDSTMMESLVQMYHKAMLVGDIDFAYLGTTTLLFGGFNAGMPLDELVTKGTRFRFEMEEYGLKTVWFFHLPPLQMLRIMSGSDESNVNPSVLEGQDMDLEEFAEQVTQTNSAVSVYGMIVCELILAVYFGDWERVEGKVDHALKYIDASEGYFTYPISIFLVVWCCFRLYDVTGRTSYRRNGYRYYRKSKQFVKQGSPMAAALHVALAAAKSMFVKKRSPQECEQEFVSALEQLEKGKYYWIQSSVADVLAEAFVKAGNHVKGEEYWKASLRPSAKWGAHEKIKHLNEKLGAINNHQKATSVPLKATGCLDGSC